MENKQSIENKQSKDVQVPEFIKRMKENGSCIILKGQGWTKTDNNKPFIKLHN